MATSPLSIAKAVKAEATRQSLIAAARDLFGEQGYAATSVDEIARQAGVTKGALYHHFRDKDDLFRAVVEDVKREVTDVVGAAFLSATTAENETMQSVVLGCRAFIEAHLEPAVQRISIIDARSVLDATTRRALDARYEVAVVRGAFRRAMRLGAIDRQPLVPPPRCGRGVRVHRRGRRRRGGAIRCQRRDRAAHQRAAARPRRLKPTARPRRSSPTVLPWPSPPCASSATTSAPRRRASSTTGCSARSPTR